MRRDGQSWGPQWFGLPWIGSSCGPQRAGTLSRAGWAGMAWRGQSHGARRVGWVRTVVGRRLAGPVVRVAAARIVAWPGAGWLVVRAGPGGSSCGQSRLGTMGLVVRAEAAWIVVGVGLDWNVVRDGTRGEVAGAPWCGVAGPMGWIGRESRAAGCVVGSRGKGVRIGPACRVGGVELSRLVAGVEQAWHGWSRGQGCHGQVGRSGRRGSERTGWSQERAGLKRGVVRLA